MKAKIKNGSISHAQLIEALPDNDSKTENAIAEDISKASSYILNMYCKNTNIANKDCVRFMSKYTIPETTSLSARCEVAKTMYKGYRRMLPPNYLDGLQKVNLVRFGC